MATGNPPPWRARSQLPKWPSAACASGRSAAAKVSWATTSPCLSLAIRRGCEPIPSTCPFRLRLSPLAPPTISKSWNLMLDEPALTTRMVSGIASSLYRVSKAQAMGVESGNGTGRHARHHAVGPARQDDWHARAQDDAGGIGVGQEGQVLRQHVAGFEVRNDQDVGIPRHGRVDALDARRFRADGVVERQRPFQQP